MSNYRYWFLRDLRVVRLCVFGSLLLALCCESSLAQRGRSQPGVRRSAFGWEAQGEKFVVLDPTSGTRAAALLAELEQGFHDAERFSANWRTETARAEPTGLIPVRPQSQRSSNPGRRFRAEADTIEEQGEVVLPIELLDTQAESSRRGLRTIGAKKQLEASGLAERIPHWAADGLADYIAQPAAPIDWFEARQPQADRRKADFEQPVAGWMPYLLNANDGAGAGRLFDLLTIASREQAPTFRQVPVGRFAFRSVEPPRLADDDFLPLFRTLNNTVDYGDWPADASHGLPVVSRLAASYDTLPRQRQMEMAQLLKLALKFGPADANVLADQRLAWDDTKRFYSRSEPHVTVDWLRRELTGGGKRSWNTLDVDGRLLTWVDRDRLASFLEDARRDYRFVWRDRQTMLEWTAADGETYRAWLEADERLPSRPLVQFKLVPQPN